MLRLRDLDTGALTALLAGYHLRLRVLAPGADIPGSYWGESEAGLVGNDVLVRPDTPLHSLLHESCHYICATPARRAALLRDAGGDDAEECAVCYLQILLSDQVAGAGREQLMRDMDDWGYSFRLGATRRWFEDDAGDALAWLRERGLVDAHSRPTGALRG